MAYCEDYPCCGHTRLDPCPNEDGSPAPVVMTAEEAAEAFYCDQCGYSHRGNCDQYDDDEEEDEEEFTPLQEAEEMLDMFHEGVENPAAWEDILPKMVDAIRNSPDADRADEFDKKFTELLTQAGCYDEDDDV